MKQQIGTVLLEYDEEGEVLSSVFTPTIQLKSTRELLNVGEQDLLNQSEVVFSQWFQLITEIEFDYRIVNYRVVKECTSSTRFENGSIESCEIRFYYELA